MNNKGFTITEAVIGLLILAFGFLAIGGLLITSTRVNHFSSNLTQATILAQDRLEAMRNLPFASLNSDPNPEIKNVSGINFARQATVSPIAGSTTMSMINVAVSWTDSSNHSISLTTIRAKE